MHITATITIVYYTVMSPSWDKFPIPCFHVLSRNTGTESTSSSGFYQRKIKELRTVRMSASKHDSKVQYRVVLASAIVSTVWWCLSFISCALHFENKFGIAEIARQVLWYVWRPTLWSSTVVTSALFSTDRLFFNVGNIQCSSDSYR